LARSPVCAANIVQPSARAASRPRAISSPEQARTRLRKRPLPTEREEPAAVLSAFTSMSFVHAAEGAEPAFGAANNTNDAADALGNSTEPPPTPHSSSLLSTAPVPSLNQSSQASRPTPAAPVPPEKQPGHSFGCAPTSFEAHYTVQRAAHKAPTAPFASHDDWKFAKWIMQSGIAQRSVDELLQLPFVRIVSSSTSSRSN
jgi:hypothetical protein